MARNRSSSRHSGRRHPLATVSLVAIGLLVTGAAYTGFSQTSATAEVDWAQFSQDETNIKAGEKLFGANCSTCHGTNGEGTEAGPSVIGSGAASVNFQVGTGRMPLAFQGPQGMQRPTIFTEEQTLQMAAYVASLAPGPDLPEARYLTGDTDVANGATLFRINCAMCHNVAGAGGALTEGKWAPPVTGVAATHVYEAMVTGPQNMPVFSDANITPEQKSDIISYLKYIDEQPAVGGLTLGSVGPVAEGLFLWIIGLGVIIAFTVWVTAKSN